MMAEALDSVTEVVPGTPGITEMRSDNGSELFDLKCGSRTPCPWITKVNGRAEIDASPPFGSVKEAVDRYGGSGPRMPQCKHGHSCQCIEEFDLKRMEEQTAELEKDLIVKELEALDVLEKLGSTKRMVEELKRQLRNEVSSLYGAAARDLDYQEQVSSPTVIKMDKVSRNSANSFDQPTSSQDLILMELQKANSNLGKTIADLKMIQASVEFFNRKMEEEKTSLEQSRNRLGTSLGTASSQEELKQIVKSVAAADENSSFGQYSFNFIEELLKAQQFKERNEVSKTEMIELKWVAAKKMEEAARAAGIVALAEIQALKGNRISQEQSVSVLEAENSKGFSKNNLEEAMLHFNDPNSSKLQATQKLNLGKQTLEEALNRVELANRKQHVGEAARQRWTPEHNKKELAVYYSNTPNDFHGSTLNNVCTSIRKGSPLIGLARPNAINSDKMPVIRPAISMRDVLRKKQVLSEEYRARKDAETGNQKVALRQMLMGMREDLTFPSKAEKDGNGQKNFISERKKLGFIHISLPNKKNTQPLNSDKGGY